MKFQAILLAVCVAACGQSGETGAPTTTTPAGPDPSVMQVEIGRYGAMLTQIEELTSARPGAAEIDYVAPATLARSLREVVWQYNIERSRVCAQGLFTEVSCGPAYAPIWISEPAETQPSLEELQARSTAVGEEVTRFWGAVCEDARARAPEADRPTVCGIG